jgi:hypothetical protein
MSAPYTPGDRVMTVEDSRIGYVKRVDWGGVYVQLTATEEHGAEERLCREDGLLNEITGG